MEAVQAQGSLTSRPVRKTVVPEVKAADSSANSLVKRAADRAALPSLAMVEDTASSKGMAAILPSSRDITVEASLDMEATLAVQDTAHQDPDMADTADTAAIHLSKRNQQEEQVVDWVLQVEPRWVSVVVCSVGCCWQMRFRVGMAGTTGTVAEVETLVVVVAMEEEASKRRVLEAKISTDASMAIDSFGFCKPRR